MSAPWTDPDQRPGGEPLCPLRPCHIGLADELKAQRLAATPSGASWACCAHTAEA